MGDEEKKLKAYLVFQSGECFEGRYLGGPDKAGEIVFNTSHSGYEEVATDPSYMNQIVVMTAPMQGNYGSFVEQSESSKIWIQGFCCLSMQNSERDSLWLKRLIDAKIPVIDQLDTRKITLLLRELGTTWGALVKAESEAEAKIKAKALIQERQSADKDWVYLASRKSPEIRAGLNPEGPKLAILDLGTKENILRELANRCRELVILPSRASASEILEYKVDALFLTNGPGDPSEVQVAPKTVASLVGRLPIMGICMGHQILALALGAKTYPLKFGHRGANHPIKDSLIQRVYVTSQNHGYAVEEKSLGQDVQITHVNLNDQSVAGIYSPSRRFMAVQFHPESCPGPHDARYLFDYFVTTLIGGRKFEVSTQ